MGPHEATQLPGKHAASDSEADGQPGQWGQESSKIKTNRQTQICLWHALIQTNLQVFFFEILFCMFSVAGAMASLLMCPSPPKSFLVSFRSLQAFASDGLETCSAQFVAFKWKQGSGGMAYLTSSIYGRLSANNRPYIIVISFNCSINHDRSRYYQNTMS